MKESNIADLLVEAGLIAQVSVVQTFRGSHYRVSKLESLFKVSTLLYTLSLDFYVKFIISVCWFVIPVHWGTRLYKLFYEAMLPILINHGKRKNLVPPTHLNYLFKSIGNTALNSDKHFLSFQSILYDEDFSEYVKNLFKVQKRDNHIIKTF